MSLKDIINDKWKEAFKAHNEPIRSAYAFMKQRITIAEKSGMYTLPLTDDDIVNLIAKEIKEREDLLSFYTCDEEEYIVAVATINELEQYLPKQMSEDEVIEIIKRIKASESNPGKVIGLTVKEVGNRFDKSKIAAMVRSI